MSFMQIPLQKFEASFMSYHSPSKATMLWKESS